MRRSWHEPTEARARRFTGAVLACVIGGALLSGCVVSPPQIISISPARGSVGVPADAPIVVKFDRPVAPASVASRFSVGPVLRGCRPAQAFTRRGGACFVVWSNSHDAFTFYHPLALFAPDSRYEITLAAGFQDTSAAGNPLDHHWDITTASSPRLVSVQPAPGSVGSPIDAVPVLRFSGAMNGAETAAAIGLEPAVPGTVVRQSPQDPRQFTLLPGRLLRTNTRYTISVSTRAIDLSGSPLKQALNLSFSTGAGIGDNHAVVLAGQGPAQPTAAYLISTDPWQPTRAMPRLWQAGAGAGHLSGAALSPDSRWLALQGADGPGSSPWLRIIDLLDGRQRAYFTDSNLPSWSPDSRFLAFNGPGGLTVYSPDSGARTAIASDGLLQQAPWWLDNGDLILPLSVPGGTVLEIANRFADTTQPLVAGGIQPPYRGVLAGSGQVAVAAANGGDVWSFDLNTGATVGLPCRETPIGFANHDAVLCTTPESASLSMISLSGGALTLPLPNGATGVQGAHLTPDGGALLYFATDSQGRRQVYDAPLANTLAGQPATAFFGDWEAKSVHLSR